MDGVTVMWDPTGRRVEAPGSLEVSEPEQRYHRVFDNQPMSITGLMHDLVARQPFTLARRRQLDIRTGEDR